MHKLFENYKIVQLGAISSVTANGNTTPVDLGPDYLDDVLVIASIGAVTGTNPTLDIALQTAETVGGTYTTNKAFPQYTDADASTVKGIDVDLQGQNSNGDEQRFLRAALTVGGTSPDFALGIVALVKPQYAGENLNDNAAL